jgi:hypothetical protein
MFATIESDDRIVCETKVTEEYTQDIKVIYTEVDEQYVVLWARTGGYQLMWKGNFESCMKEYRDIVGDTFHDSLPQYQQGHVV